MFAFRIFNSPAASVNSERERAIACYKNSPYNLNIVIGRRRGCLSVIDKNEILARIYLSNARCVTFIIQQESMKRAGMGDEMERETRAMWVLSIMSDQIKQCRSCNIENGARAVLVDRTNRQRLLRTSAALTTSYENNTFWLDDISFLLVRYFALASRYRK